METVFRALADPTRRALLDALFEQDGQTLVALTAGHDMTRIAVAKHLRLLEEAGLVVSRRRGREKLHFLNPVPIRLIHDRWVSKYTEPWAAGLAGLKTELEHTDGEGLRDLHPHDPGAAVGGDHRPGDPGQVPLRRRRRVRLDAGFALHVRRTPAPTAPLAEGENLVVEPPHRLVQTMHTLWSEDAEREGTSRVTWEIEPVGDSCRLTVTHDQLSDDAPPELYGGWPMILSGLKTWLETGQTLTTPGSLMYGRRHTTTVQREEITMPTTTITDVRTIGINVTDQDDALAFFVDTLGFEKRLDAPISPTIALDRGRSASSASTSIALNAAEASSDLGEQVGADTGIRFTVPDAAAEHAALHSPRRRASANSSAGTVFRRCSASTIPTATASTSSRRCHDCAVRTRNVRLLPDIAPARLGLG